MLEQYSNQILTVFSVSLTGVGVNLAGIVVYIYGQYYYLVRNGTLQSTDSLNLQTSNKTMWVKLNLK